MNRLSFLFELLIRRLVESKKSFRSFNSWSSSSVDVSSKSEDSCKVILLIVSTKTLWSAVNNPMAVKTKSRKRWIIFSRSSSLSSRIWNLCSILCLFLDLNLSSQFWKKPVTSNLSVLSNSPYKFARSFSLLRLEVYFCEEVGEPSLSEFVILKIVDASLLVRANDEKGDTINSATEKIKPIRPPQSPSQLSRP